MVGNSISLTATEGSIGSSYFEIDSSNQASGVVNASAQGNVNLKETQGTLNLGAVLSKTGDADLAVLSGSILDVLDDSTADIQAASIDLQVSGGGIGTLANDLEIHGAGAPQVVQKAEDQYLASGKS